MKPISEAQMKLLVRFGRSYEEIRNWSSAYAGKVIAGEIKSRQKKAPVKKTAQLSLEF